MFFLFFLHTLLTTYRRWWVRQRQHIWAFCGQSALRERIWAVLGHLWALLGCFRCFCGRSWAALGAFVGGLRLSLAFCGRFLQHCRGGGSRGPPPGNRILFSKCRGWQLGAASPGNRIILDEIVSVRYCRALRGALWADLARHQIEKCAITERQSDPKRSDLPRRPKPAWATLGIISLQNCTAVS